MYVCMISMSMDVWDTYRCVCMIYMITMSIDVWCICVWYTYVHLYNIHMFVIYVMYTFLTFWDGRIYQLHLCRGVEPLAQRVSWYDSKPSDGEFPVMLELWGMQSNPSLPSIPSPHWPGVITADRILSLHQIGLFDI